MCVCCSCKALHSILTSHVAHSSGPPNTFSLHLHEVWASHGYPNQATILSFLMSSLLLVACESRPSFPTTKTPWICSYFGFISHLRVLMSFRDGQCKPITALRSQSPCVPRILVGTSVPNLKTVEIHEAWQRSTAFNCSCHLMAIGLCLTCLTKEEHD